MTTVATSIAEHHALNVLAPRGLDPDFVSRLGVYSIAGPDELPEELRDHPLAVPPALVIPWHSPTQGTVFQLRPDEPLDNAAGDPVKYLFPTGSVMVLNELRGVGDVAEDAPVLLAEGTFQSMTALKYAPKEFAVYGMSGCWSWRKGSTSVPINDLGVVEGRPVVIALDADAASNANVYSAGMALADALKAEGATDVRFLRLAGAGARAGLDDVLGQRPEDKRAPYLLRLIEAAAAKPADRKPAARKTSHGEVSPFFDGEKLKVKTLAETVIGLQPAALTSENKIAVYMNGVYRIDGTGFLSSLTDLLGESFRTSHASNAESYTVGQLAKHGTRLPERLSEPLLNTLSGMVDLRTGELKEHDPKFFSTVQIPVHYDPAATCPTYESWISEMVGSQVDDLEESVALMLDPTITPTKGVFLFGPSRSGKSTMLRILQVIAGQENYSAVSLHQLAEDRFAAANLYGKMLNVAADLSAAHVEDVSMYKLMTGEDPVNANRKYGGQFAFVNRALFVFSANEIPTVGESSKAYSERVKPFHFPNSFAGREDPAIEARIMAEIPGVLNRLIRAHQRRAARGKILPTDTRVRELFEQASDRVRQFVAECCEVVPVEIGPGGTKNATISTTTELFLAFRRWVEDEGRASLAKSKFRLRLSNVPGATEAISSGKSRGWNLRILSPAEREERSNSGTLSVLDHPTERGMNTPEAEEEGVHPVGGSYGSKGTKLQTSETDPAGDPIDLLISEAEDVPAPECPDCGAEEDLIPPTFFIFACRSCNPDTFTR